MLSRPVLPSSYSLIHAPQTTSESRVLAAVIFFRLMEAQSILTYLMEKLLLSEMGRVPRGSDMGPSHLTTENGL